MVVCTRLADRCGRDGVGVDEVENLLRGHSEVLLHDPEGDGVGKGADLILMAAIGRLVGRNKELHAEQAI